ncbi:MAG: ATP-dependent helicase, partial [Thermoguttaceae bacterium]|nr:ATP-dependent helicase [Thermoguttaceae bacterium]
FDGQYGVIRLFTDQELRTKRSSQCLFGGGEISPSPGPACAGPPSPAAGRGEIVGSGSVPSAALSHGPPGERPAEPKAKPGEGGQGREMLLGVTPSPYPSPAEGRGEAEGLLAGLDPQQRAAVQCVEGPVLILAGPGTGKTRTLTHRIAYLVAEHGVEPASCLAITFSRRAAAEMRSRLDRLLPHLAERIPVMTFHGFGWQLLREYMRRLSEWLGKEASNRAGETSFPPHPILSRQGRRKFEGISRQGRGEGEEVPRQGRGAAAPSPGLLRRPLSPAEGRGEEERGFSLPPGLRERFALVKGGVCVASELQRRELLTKALDVSDTQADRMLKKISLVKRTTAPPSEDPKLQEALRVYEAEMGRRGWLDFDDLVLLPLKILQSDSAWQAECQQRFRFISVDEFQDIDAAQYGLVQALAPPDGNICVIGDPDQSIYGFRGADAGFFERFLADYPKARRFVLTKNYRSSRVIVEAAGQMIAAASLAPDRRLEAQPGRVPHIEIHTCPTERAEAELVVHRIEELLGGPTFFSLDSRRSQGQTQTELSFSDIAVLYRTEAQAEPLVEALHRSGMPFQVCSHRPLAELPGVQRLLQELHRQENPPAAPLPERVRRLLESFPSADTETRSEQAEKASSEQTEKKTSEESPETISPAVRDILQQLAEKYGDDLAGFLAELAMTTEADLWDSRAERISLLTLHAAKGLEFPVVFIVGCEDGLIPLRFSGQEDQNRLAEERRLLFVGMTRAKEHLILTHARRRLWQGKVRWMEPSPFLADVERQLVAFQEHRPTVRRRPSAEQPHLFE